MVRFLMKQTLSIKQIRGNKQTGEAEIFPLLHVKMQTGGAKIKRPYYPMCVGYEY